MNKQSNKYIIGYSVILVVVVATILSYAAISLGPVQQKNAEIEMMGSILGSVNLLGDADKATNKTSYIEEQYSKYIVESFLVNNKGEKKEASQADIFKILSNLKAAYAAEPDVRELPVFISKNDAGTMNYIIPVNGTGLWGPVWGYIALNTDMNTIDGVVFDHKSETPGLGAEIATPFFEDQYIGKTIFENTEFVGVKVTKGAGSSKGNDHAVDAISGGTITSRAVEVMIINCLKDYEPFIVKQKEVSTSLTSVVEPAQPINE